MNFDFDEDQQELRRTVRRFLEHSWRAGIRGLMAAEPGYDRAVWERMAEELGLHGLAIPEEYGGAGFSFTELGIVLEEMGRALLCAPFFASVVLAGELLQGDRRRAGAQGLPAGDRLGRHDRHRGAHRGRRGVGTFLGHRARGAGRRDVRRLNGTKTMCRTGSARG